MEALEATSTSQIRWFRFLGLPPILKKVVWYWRFRIDAVSMYERRADYDMRADLVTVTWHRAGKQVSDVKSARLERQYQAFIARTNKKAH